LGTDRQRYILQLLDQKGEVQLQQLKEHFDGVSMMTLRRDLISLEKDGRLIRTYGGAVSTRKLELNGEEDAYSIRASENVESKMVIAEKAVTLVEKGRSVFFDSGSTMMSLAKALPDGSYSILTSGANIALELIKRPMITVVTLGGMMNRNTFSSSGPNALLALDNMNIDLAFMAASGFSSVNGFSVSNMYECELKKKVVRRANKVIMLMDTSKIGKDLAYTYAAFEEIDIWVCEKPLPDDVRSKAEKYGIQTI